MIEWPQVDLIVITYNRTDEIQRTVDALETNVIYPRNRLHYLIADDCTPGPYGAILGASKSFQDLDTYTFVPTAENRGWGGNVNRALRFSTAPYILQIEDDYVLRQQLDLQAAVATLQVKPEIGLMRFRGTAGDYLVFHQQEADISAYLPDYQDGVGLPGRLTYFLIDGGSPGLYIYSHGLHLKRADFHDHYGYYPEGLKLGATEESYAHTVKDRMRTDPYAPVLTIQPAWVPMWLDHIGKSMQHTEVDREVVPHV